MLQELVAKQDLATFALAPRVGLNASVISLSRATRCGKSDQRSEPSRSRVPDRGTAGAAFFRTCMAFTVLNEICPAQATPELIELTARLGSIMPYRKAARGYWPSSRLLSRPRHAGPEAALELTCDLDHPMRSGHGCNLFNLHAVERR